MQSSAVNGGMTYNSSSGLVTVASAGAYFISCLLSIAASQNSTSGTVFIIINGATPSPNIAVSYAGTLEFIGTQIVVLPANATIGIGFNNAVTLDDKANWNIFKIN